MPVNLPKTVIRGLVCFVAASGYWSKMATDITIIRVADAGAIPMDTFAMVAERMRTWNRAEGSWLGAIIAEHIVPTYKCWMEN